jgi:hypothetical protein
VSLELSFLRRCPVWGARLPVSGEGMGAAGAEGGAGRWCAPTFVHDQMHPLELGQVRPVVNDHLVCGDKHIELRTLQQAAARLLLALVHHLAPPHRRARERHAG